MRALIEAGDGRDAKDSNGMTILHKAAEEEDMASTNLLLGMKANKEATNKNMQTPLHVAVNSKNSTIVEALLKAGANVNALDNKRQTPLHAAATIGDDALDGLKFLVARPELDVNMQDNNKQTALHCAAGSENNVIETVKALFGRNADAEKSEIHKRTPLHTAAYNGKHDIVAALLEEGSETGAEGDSETRVEEIKAQIEAEDGSKGTALHLAAQLGQYEVAKLLLEKGAVKDAKDETEQTPLHRAASHGQDELVELLLEDNEEGAELKDGHGHTPLYCALANGHRRAAQLLEKKWEVGDVLSRIADSKLQDLNRLILEHAREGSKEAVGMLIDLGADMNTPVGHASDTYRWTPLHIGVLWDHPGVVQVLLDKGANRYATDYTGATPQRHAQARNNPQIKALFGVM